MCYVGSSKDIYARIQRHFSEAEKGSANCFHKAIRVYGVNAFDLEILEECTEEVLLVRERFYIAFLNSASESGFNTCRFPTSNYAATVSDATRERLRIASTGRLRSYESIEKSRQAMLGRKFSPETLAKMSAAKKGKHRGPCSQEIKDKIGNANRGRKRTDETRRLIGSITASRTVSEATKLKMTESHKRRWEKIRLRNREKIGAPKKP